MSVLSQSAIKERLNRRISDAQSLVITPLDEGAIGFDSVDLRLGAHFLFPGLLSDSAVDLQASGNAKRGFNVHIPKDGTLVLPAHQTVLGVTEEFIKLPFDLSGQILTKSSVARTFLVIETAPWIHPNYRGCLTLEMANVSNTALVLHPGISIGQLILLTIEKPLEMEELSGRYIGPIRPESPLGSRRHEH